MLTWNCVNGFTISDGGTLAAVIDVSAKIRGGAEQTVDIKNDL